MLSDGRITGFAEVGLPFARNPSQKRSKFYELAAFARRRIVSPEYESGDTN